MEAAAPLTALEADIHVVAMTTVQYQTFKNELFYKYMTYVREHVDARMTYASGRAVAVHFYMELLTVAYGLGDPKVAEQQASRVLQLRSAQDVAAQELALESFFAGHEKEPAGGAVHYFILHWVRPVPVVEGREQVPCETAMARYEGLAAAVDAHFPGAAGMDDAVVMHVGLIDVHQHAEYALLATAPTAPGAVDASGFAAANNRMQLMTVEDSTPLARHMHSASRDEDVPWAAEEEVGWGWEVQNMPAAIEASASQAPWSTATPGEAEAAVAQLVAAMASTAVATVVEEEGVAASADRFFQEVQSGGRGALHVADVWLQRTHETLRLTLLTEAQDAVAVQRRAAVLTPAVHQEIAKIKLGRVREAAWSHIVYTEDLKKLEAHVAATPTEQWPATAQEAVPLVTLLRQLQSAAVESAGARAAGGSAPDMPASYGHYTAALLSRGRPLMPCDGSDSDSDPGAADSPGEDGDAVVVAPSLFGGS